MFKMQSKRKIYRLILIVSALLLLVVTFLYLWYEYFNTRHWKQFELTDSAEREMSSYYKVTLDYPPEWTTSDIEYLDLNTDISFKTGTEDYEVKIFVGTWREPNGCGSYKQDKEYYDVMSCTSSTNEKFTFIEGEYYDKKDEQKFVYQKDIYFHDRAFEFRALATEYEDLDFPKKVARFFSVERVNIDQIPESREEQAINKTEDIEIISKPVDIQATVDSLARYSAVSAE